MIVENLDVYTSDHGVEVIFGAQSCMGILDEPDNSVAGGFEISTGYSLLFKTTALVDLKTGSNITVAGNGYKVRELYKIDDGAFSRASLTKS